MTTLATAGMLMSRNTQAENRFAVQPSAAINGVSDSNLFFSPQSPASDRIFRIRPALGILFVSPRLSASMDYSMDADRYATHTRLSDARARQYGAIDLQYRADPRLSLALTSSYTDTTTPAEFNIVTDLGALRRRGQQLTLMPSARYEISTRLTAHASMSATRQSLSGGPGTRSRFLSAGIDRRITPLDSMSVDVDGGQYAFDTNGIRKTTNTAVLRTKWTRQLDRQTSFNVSAGPRITAGSGAPEVAASLTHRWQFTSLTIAAAQTETIAVGISDPVRVRTMDLRWDWTPKRDLDAYLAPAVYRTMRSGLQATVYHAAVGARYALTPLMNFDAAYSFDSQHGGIDLALPGGTFSRSVLSIGFSTRWSMPDAMNGGAR
jgi:hypothetical protein